MEKTKQFFSKIDQFIFSRLDILKSDPSVSKLNDVLLNLTDEQQKIFIQLLVFLFLLAPYIGISIFWWSNYSIKSKLVYKEQIIEQIGLLNGNKDTLNNISNKYLITSAIYSRDEIENKIINIASRYNINANKVQLIDFIPLSGSSTIAKSEAKIKFTDFGTVDFSNFMRELIEVEQFKILKIDINKNLDNNLLQGTLEIRHLGRASNNQ